MKTPDALRQPPAHPDSVPTTNRGGNRCELLEPLSALAVPAVPTVPTVFGITETLYWGHISQSQFSPQFLGSLKNQSVKSGGNSGGNSGNGGNSQWRRGLEAFPLIERGVNKWEHTPLSDLKP